MSVWPGEPEDDYEALIAVLHDVYVQLDEPGREILDEACKARGVDIDWDAKPPA